MLIEGDTVPAFNICTAKVSLAQLQHSCLRALLSCTVVQKELDTHIKSSKEKTMPRMYLQQDYLKIILFINEAVWLLEVVFKSDFYF